MVKSEIFEKCLNCVYSMYVLVVVSEIVIFLSYYIQSLGTWDYIFSKMIENALK